MKHLLQATQIQAAKTKQSNTKCRDRQPGIFFLDKYFFIAVRYV